MAALSSVACPLVCVATLSLGLALASPRATAQADPFWFEPAAGGARWRVVLGGEGVSDGVAHAPNAPAGGFEPATRLPRSASAALALHWRPSSEWSLRASVVRRSLVSLRDRYTIDGVELGVARRLPSPHASTRLALVADLRANRAGELYKNSWTRLGGARLTEARLFDARDEGAGLAFASRTSFGQGVGDGREIALSALIGIGLTRTGHERLAGVGVDGGGCRYGFEAADGTGELTLLEPCRQFEAFHEEYANERGIERRLGLAPGSDLAYTSRVARVGLGIVAVWGRTGAALSWVHGRHARADLDPRIRERGARAVASSHTTSLRVSVAASRVLRLHAGAHYRSTTYLDELPLLYNALTAGRFARDTLSFGAGLSLAF